MDPGTFSLRSKVMLMQPSTYSTLLPSPRLVVGAFPLVAPELGCDVAGDASDGLNVQHRLDASLRTWIGS